MRNRHEAEGESYERRIQVCLQLRNGSWSGPASATAQQAPRSTRIWAARIYDAYSLQSAALSAFGAI